MNISPVARDTSSGGNFINNRHTFQHFRSALFHPQVADRSRFEHWSGKGAEEMRQRCNRKARRILAQHEVTAKPKVVRQEIKAILLGTEERLN